jgi:hypothetical protein
MSIITIPFNDPKGIAEIEKILNDKKLGSNVRSPFNIPIPKDKDGLMRISRVIEGLDCYDLLDPIQTNTEVIFKIDGREVYRTHNSTVLPGRMSLLENAFGIVPNPEDHTLTLNNILGIPHGQTNNVILNRLERKADYFMIGNGATSLSVPGKVYSPKNYETKLFKEIPFRFVPVSTDLNSAEKAMYRFRKIVEISGNDYIGYFAKKFDPGNLYLEYNDARYTPQESDTAPVDENDSSHRLRGGAVLVYIHFQLSIEEKEVKEFFKVTQGTLELASVNELGLVYSADLPNNIDPTERYELAGAELFSKVTSKDYPLNSEGSSRIVEYKIYAR